MKNEHTATNNVHTENAIPHIFVAIKVYKYLVEKWIAWLPLVKRILPVLERPFFNRKTTPNRFVCRNPKSRSSYFLFFKIEWFDGAECTCVIEFGWNIPAIKIKPNKKPFEFGFDQTRLTAINRVLGDFVCEALNAVDRFCTSANWFGNCWMNRRHRLMLTD